MAQGLLLIDARGVVAVANHQAARLLGVDRDFLAGRPHFRELRRAQAAAGEYAATSPAFRAWIESGEMLPPVPVYERLRPDGTVLEVRSVRLPEGGMVLTYTDVTARRQAEADLRRKTAMLDATLETMDQGLFMIDADGVLQICNERAIALLDLPPGMARAKPTFADIIAHQHGTGEFSGSLVGVDPWLALKGTLLETPQVYERTRPNGTVLEVRTAPLAGGGAVRTFTDVTERRAAEARVAFMARHDALTQLPNRTLFRERFEGLLGEGAAGGGPLAVLCIAACCATRTSSRAWGATSSWSCRSAAGPRRRARWPGACSRRSPARSSSTVPR